MKSLFLAILATLSLNAFSQSYLIMENGITITTDSSGYAYDFGHYAFPQKVLLKGGQYFVEEGGVIATIDYNGLLFRKYELIPKNIKGKGLNYFLSEEGFLYTIDRRGYVHVTEDAIYKNALNFGGNYFTVAVNAEKTEVDFYAITTEGTVLKIDMPSFKVKDIVSYGGNYFMNSRGVIYTVATDGKLQGRDEMRVGILAKRGGNFFTDTSGQFFTVNEAGGLVMPAIPVNLRISAIHKVGSNYFIDQAGNFYVVDKNGNVFEKVMRDHDFRLAKVISL